MFERMIGTVCGLILIVGLVTATIVGAQGLLARVGASPNAELVRTAREAVELAHDAQTDSRSAVLWTGRFRLLALVIGVSVPLIVAFLIGRSAGQSELHPAEILECMEQHVLPATKDPPVPVLPSPCEPESARAQISEARLPDLPAQ